MTKLAKLWFAAVGAVLAALVTAALTLHHSFALTSICDIVESLLLLSGTASFIPLARRSKGRTRLFWSLIILGLGLWFAYQLTWMYYEIFLRRDMPDLFAGDVILFLNIVPLMAAIALRPHVPRDEYSARLGRLDFALLLVWWLYQYVLMVIPWQYVVADSTIYNHDLNTIYTTEKIAFLAGLAVCWLNSKGEWRKFYARFFVVSFCYAASSAMANWAIGHNVYYSGGLYDIGLAASMAGLTWVGLMTKAEEPQQDARQVSTLYGVWVARCGMIAVFSLPAFAVWALLDAKVPVRIRVFRLGVTLMAALLMGAMVFIRQRLLDRELIRLLNHSRESFDNLKRLQSQILQSEKLASIGQLVGGAAHELNNPITAMLGYSDLLLNTKLNLEQQPVAAKIGQNVRRTKSLVASLISFARQGPSPKSPLDINTLVRTAVKLTQPQWQAVNVEVRTELDASLPKVLGDSNQLLQVCLQLIGNCLHFMSQNGGKALTVRTQRQAATAVLQFATDSCGNAESTDSSDSPEVLALSACRGILQEHRGDLTRESFQDGLALNVVLPAAEMLEPKAKGATARVQWQSRPSA